MASRWFMWVIVGSMCDAGLVVTNYSFGPRFQDAISLIDEANAADPVTIEVDGQPLPKELTHARMLMEWMGRLLPEPTEPLLLAARAHHIRRWESPRDSFPEGRRGYLRWRRDLQMRHARYAREILEKAGYEEEAIKRVEQIIRKETSKNDPEGQAFEDGLTLVFLETQLHDLVLRTNNDTMVDVIRKTWQKISPAARELALASDISPADRSLIEQALA
tara:strand:- start:26455 stop:27111 length:657 start_codon:yes stop_codon:yes gene_type:complete